MRTLALALAVSLASLFGVSSTANAGATVDLVWSGTTGTGTAGGTAIFAQPGDLVSLDVLLTAGTEGLSSWGISVAFDADLGDELDLAAQPLEFGLAPTVTCTPFPTCFFGTPTIEPLSPGVGGTVESTSTQTGFVFTFEAATLGAGVSASFGQFKIGEILFQVTGNGATDGADVQSGFFDSIADGAFSNAGAPVDMTFNSAAVNVPEPGTVALLGLGLVGLGLAGRRNRK